MKFSVPVQFTPNAKMRLVNSHQTLFLHGNRLGFRFKEVGILGNSREFQGNLKAFVWSFQRGTPRWCLQRTTALRQDLKNYSKPYASLVLWANRPLHISEHSTLRRKYFGKTCWEIHNEQCPWALPYTLDGVQTELLSQTFKDNIPETSLKPQTGRTSPRSRNWTNNMLELDVFVLKLCNLVMNCDILQSKVCDIGLSHS